MLIFELEEKIKDMPFEEALAEVEKELAYQGENPDEELLILKAQVLFHWAGEQGRMRNDEAMYANYGQVISILEPLIDKKQLESYYPYLLYALTVSHLRLGWAEEGMAYAEQYYETHHDDQEASILLACAYVDTASEPEKGLQLVEAYLEAGDYLRGVPVKIGLLIYAQRLAEALALIEFSEQAYPEHAELWTEKRAMYYHFAGDVEAAVKLTDAQLESATDKNARCDWFRNLYGLFRQHKTDGELAEYVKGYLKRFPQDDFAYAALAAVTGDINAEIELLEQAHRLEADYAPALLEKYLERDGAKDKENYFRTLETFLSDEETSHWHLVQQTMYGKFYPYDTGQCVRILEKDLIYNPDHECTYTMLGKLHECGIGVAKDAQKAFSYYEKAYKEHKSPCGCSAVFYAFALYFGVGTAPDREKAKALILEVIHERDNDADRDCMYAMTAFEEGGERFDKKFALELLKKNKKDPACTFLLFKYAQDEKEKAKYFKLFKKAVKEEADQLERDHLQKYIGNPDLPFVPFIRN